VSAGVSDCFARRSATSKISSESIKRPEGLTRDKPSDSALADSPTPTKTFSSCRGCPGREEVSCPAHRQERSPGSVSSCGSRPPSVRTRRERTKSSVAGPFLAGAGVYHMGLDPRDGRTVYAAAPHVAEPWGPAVYRGRIGSEPKPTSSSPKFKEGSDLAVSRVWHIEPGSSNEPDTIYAGVEPAALFRSEDRGDTWEDCGALNYHPTR